jgi:hypothetical protein
LSRFLILPQEKNIVTLRKLTYVAVAFFFAILSILPVSIGNLITVQPVAAQNGCGPEGFGGLVPELWFTSACNTHDICYGTLGASKSACDTQFYNNMRAICSSRYPHWYQAVQRNACYASAWTYYQAVKQFGQSAFDNAQKHAR